MARFAVWGLHPMTPYETGPEFAGAMDAADPLRSFRGEFNFPRAVDGRDCVYLCGNSLGLQPKLAVQYVQEELQDWGDLAVEGHLHARRPWLPYHRLATGELAHLTGAEPQEVVAMNTLTVNLHILMTTFYRPTASRYKILIESTAFPSDRFAVISQVRLHGFDPGDGVLQWHPRAPGAELRIEDLQHILEENGDEIALLLLPGVQYYNGQVLDMPGLCQLAREAGCTIGLDLAHAIGNVALNLHDWAPDFAAWCSYKYLNGGPGAVAGAFVHARHLDREPDQQMLGWWGHAEETRFKMAPTFTAAKGAESWQLSNPPILALAPLLASLKVFSDAGIERLQAKSASLTAYLDYLLQQGFNGRISSITPPHARGCQMSLTVDDDRLDARQVFARLQQQNVIADWREPNVIRVAPTPLYNSFADVYEFSRRLEAVLGA